MPIIDLSVTVGITSLITYEPDTQRIQIAEVFIYDEEGVVKFDPTTLLHNIALLRVNFFLHVSTLKW